MPIRRYIWGGLALAAMPLLGFCGWLASLPPQAVGAAPPAVPQAETEAMLAALKPRTKARPLVAIVGINDATETTDYLLPASALRRADVADVVLLASDDGPVQLYPALRVQPDATIAAFDAAHPGGADYVIVPAMRRDDDPRVLRWLQGQSAKGARIIGICAGAKVVAASGLLEGRRATTHWYYLDQMLRRSPAISHVADRRMVADGSVVTTTGISASIPMMLTLIEAIGGRARAEAVARDLGISAWDARHSSAAFALTRRFAMTVLLNRLAFWRHEKLGIHLRSGMDGAALALLADGWSRTYRATVVTYAAAPAPVETAHGLRIIPDRVASDWPAPHRLEAGATPAAARDLDRMLVRIGARYGDATRDLVAMQLEYPRPERGR